MTDKITLYGHATCPMLPPVKAMLDRSSAPYDYINIRRDDEARERVREINNGYESVPTLVFPDGSTLTEPSSGALKQKLESLGYEVPFSGVLLANLHWVVIGAAIIFALLDLLGVL